MTREMNKIVEQKVQKYENEYPFYMNYDYSNKSWFRMEKIGRIGSDIIEGIFIHPDGKIQKFKQEVGSQPILKEFIE